MPLPSKIWVRVLEGEQCPHARVAYPLGQAQHVPVVVRILGIL